MCDICEKWEKDEIDSKEAMVLIGNALKVRNGKRYGKEHLMKVASKILDEDVPFNPTDTKAERAFWKQTHRRENEES